MTTADAISLEDLAGARVGVVGAGRTGLAVIEALSDLGARIYLLDTRSDAADAVTAPLERVTVGDDAALADALAQCRPDLLIVSPGVPATGPVLTGARRDGTRVWSEIELAWRLQRSTRPEVPWIVVTGTDGKTTTVGMLSAVLTAAGLNAPAVGNIGAPAITTVLEGRADAMAVELSSFQLHTTRTLSPLAAACLNLAPDHLDWHGGLAAYGADKARVYARTRRAAVYNTADASTRAMVERADVAEGCLAVGFTLAVPALGQVGVVEDLLVDRALHADLWLIQYNADTPMTYASLSAEYTPYARFDAFAHRRIYGCNTHNSHYYEEVPLHPDRLLAELIAIIHPELLPDHRFRYFSPLR